MIENFWDNIELYCGNHKEKIRFTCREGKDTFYACPHYMLKDEEHPDGHEENEQQCYNRVAFSDALGIIEKLSDKVENDLLNNIKQDYTGYKYKYKHYQAKVEEYKRENFKIKISVLNNRILSK